MDIVKKKIGNMESKPEKMLVSWLWAGWDGTGRAAVSGGPL